MTSPEAFDVSEIEPSAKDLEGIDEINPEDGDGEIANLPPDVSGNGWSVTILETLEELPQAERHVASDKILRSLPRPGLRTAHPTDTLPASMPKTELKPSSDAESADAGQEDVASVDKRRTTLNSNVLADLTKILKESEWRQWRTCSDDDKFFPDRGAATAPALAECASCAVQTECLTFAIVENERFGIWGGISERTRRVVRQVLADDVPFESVLRVIIQEDAAQLKASVVSKKLMELAAEEQGNNTPMLASESESEVNLNSQSTEIRVESGGQMGTEEQLDNRAPMVLIPKEYLLADESVRLSREARTELEENREDPTKQYVALESDLAIGFQAESKLANAALDALSQVDDPEVEEIITSRGIEAYLAAVGLALAIKQQREIEPPQEPEIYNTDEEEPLEIPTSETAEEETVAGEESESPHEEESQPEVEDNLETNTPDTPEEKTERADHHPDIDHSLVETLIGDGDDDFTFALEAVLAKPKGTEFQKRDLAIPGITSGRWASVLEKLRQIQQFGDNGGIRGARRYHLTEVLAPDTPASTQEAEDSLASKVENTPEIDPDTLPQPDPTIIETIRSRGHKPTNDALEVLLSNPSGTEFVRRQLTGKIDRATFDDVLENLALLPEFSDNGKPRAARRYCLSAVKTNHESHADTGEVQQKLIDYLTTNPGIEFSIAELAHVVGMETKYLASIIKSLGNEDVFPGFGNNGRATKARRYSFTPPATVKKT